ncbi:damage-inducible protein DinB [Flavobacterium salilacus subsp. salilacus]|uniref:DinB family protein n=1 Tax=Flavobacterium TaxID=237 RepID=UPI001074A677|nr:MULTISPECIES: DinB family protein [Flavobacterium]KAF2518709.1 damage-inducible protein DinB [Flavobacterium salilacus subsp. salilacus]MBE1613673.1 damage-inducible protein DinB [Flavobacterium sp. SaA2.13]
MKSFFKELFDYTYHYNSQIIASLMADSAIHKKSVLLLNHTINAHEIWNARIMGKTADVGVWNMRSINVLQEQNKINYENSLQISDTFDLDDIIQYTNSKGMPFQNSVRDILFHIINHSTYHRGQIASYYKQEGGTPIVSDYIFHKR